MNFDVAGGAVLESGCRLIMERWSPGSTHRARIGMALKTKDPHFVPLEQLGVVRAMRSVANHTSFHAQGGMLKHKRALLFGMALQARDIGTRRQSHLLELKPAMRVVTVTALHGAFQDLVPERRIELRFDLIMTREAEHRLLLDQHLLGGCCRGVRSMAIDAAHIVPPMLAPPKIVVFLFACVAPGQVSEICFAD